MYSYAPLPRSFKVFAAVRQSIYCLLHGVLPVIRIGALYCRSTAVLLAMHVWLYVVAVLYMVSGAGRPRSAGQARSLCLPTARSVGG